MKKKNKRKGKKDEQGRPREKKKEEKKSVAGRGNVLGLSLKKSTMAPGERRKKHVKLIARVGSLHKILTKGT